MKSKLPRFLHTGWCLLTDVPGQAETSQAVRLRRAAPAILPLALLLLAVPIYLLAVRPSRQREREAHAPLRELAVEVGALREAWPTERVVDLQTRLTQARKLFVASPEEAQTHLQRLRTQAAALGWELRAQTPELIEGQGEGESTSLQSRVRLTPTVGLMEPFPALLDLLEKLSSAEKRIDLIRLGVRADEQGRTTAELQLRFALLPDDG